MENVKMIRVEVAYACPGEQVIIPVEVPEGATLKQALLLSRIQERFPEIDPDTAKVGVFGKHNTLTSKLRAGDRMEIYRPLVADPRLVRKQRAAAAQRKAR